MISLEKEEIIKKNSFQHAEERDEQEATFFFYKLQFAF